MNHERTRAWRRFQKNTKCERKKRSKNNMRREKNWKLLYLRQEKLARAKQLGFVYPWRNNRWLIDDHSCISHENNCT